MENNSEILEKNIKYNPIDSQKSTKKKMVFFVKPGLDSFLGDIINRLSAEYETKKIMVTNYKQIDEGMEWAEICWFEWCDELIAYGSRNEMAQEKKILCRLHRYEALTEYPKNVFWENVDKLILVTDHLKRFLYEQMPNIGARVDIVTIQNGVNLSKFNFKEREKGFNVAYVGYIHERKNPVLLLQIINSLVKIDQRYKLLIAGQFQDALIQLYWNYQIEQMGLQNNIIFQGWQAEIMKWLNDKNYILSTSIHESFGYGIAEAMAVGIKPIIHNFVFSQEIWGGKYLFNCIDEAVESIIEDKYNSIEYRKFIEDNYSLEKQISKTKNLVNSVIKDCADPQKVSPSMPELTIIDELINQGELYFSQGDLYNSKICFQNILNHDPNHLEALNNLGVISFQEGNYDNALYYLQKVNQINDSYLEAIRNTGKVFEAKGNFLEALNWYKKILHKDGVTVDILNSMAHCFLELDDLKTAKIVLKESLKKDANQDDIKRLLNDIENLSSKEGFEKIKFPCKDSHFFRKFSSEEYWIERYKKGGSSGAGSYNKLAQFKAEILNNFVKEHDIKSVIEYGCGDGNQLRLATYESYTGFDVSPEVLSRCKKIFHTDKTKSFKLMYDYKNETAELTLSLDVVYHLIEDDVFELYMKRLFDSSTQFVIVYSSNKNEQDKGQSPHMKHRKFTSWIDENIHGWRLIRHVPNRYSHSSAISQFYIFKNVK